MSRKDVVLLCFAFALTMILGACRTYKSTQGTKLEFIRAADLWDTLQQQQIDYTTFSTRCKFEANSEGSRESASVDIHLLHDSLIWLSFRKASIEGARVLISPDSIKIIDRTEKVYYPFPYSFLKAEFGLEVPFTGLQSLILGNIFSEEEGKLSTSFEDDKYYLFSETDGMESEFWFLPGSFDLSDMKLYDAGTRQTFHVNFEEREEVQNHRFAGRRTVHLQSELPQPFALDLDLKFSKIKLNEPVSFSFRVNPKYEVVRWGQ